MQTWHLGQVDRRSPIRFKRQATDAAKYRPALVHPTIVEVGFPSSVAIT